MLVDGQPIKDLCLTFVLPGGPLSIPAPSRPGSMQHVSSSMTAVVHVSAHRGDLCAHITPEHAGYPQYELMEGGSDVVVDSHNVGEYIDAVVNATMDEGIAAQMQAFR